MPRVRVESQAKALDFLREHLPQWKTPTLRQRLHNGLVMKNGVPVLSGAELLRVGDMIEVMAVPPRPDAFLPIGLGEPPMPVLYADDDLVAIEKPSGLLSVATDREKNNTAIRLMREWLLGDDRESGETGERQLHAAHRLDREASGVLLLARSLETKRKLAADWKQFEKVYLSVTDGIPDPRQGEINVPLWEDKALFVRPAQEGKGEEAHTFYKTIKKVRNRALLEVRLGTGRKHQIRAHLASIDCPIVGDLRYGVSKARRLALHAHRLLLRHPVSGKQLEIVSPVPTEFKKMLSEKV
jgi:23S rRNA pseudouridine1911/1915/1917 synthase